MINIPACNVHYETPLKGDEKQITYRGVSLLSDDGVIHSCQFIPDMIDYLKRTTLNNSSQDLHIIIHN